MKDQGVKCDFFFSVLLVCLSSFFLFFSLEKKKNKKNKKKNQLQWCFETKAVKANPFTGFNDSVKTARLKRALFPSPRPQDRG